MRRISTILIAATIPLSVKSCNPIRNIAEKQIMDESGITQTEDYKEYETLKESGSVSEDGQFVPAEEETTDYGNGSIKVSFARNSRLSVSYFKDPERQEAFSSYYMLNPGDTIYATEPKTVIGGNAAYKFTKFILFDNTTENRTSIAEYANCSIQIPKDYTGDSLVIIPSGEFEEKTLSFSAEAIENEEKYVELNGKWYLNGKRINTDTLTVSPFESCKVEFDYSNYKDEYFFYDSEPEYFYCNDEKGIVEFINTDTNESGKEYKIYLRRYTTVNLVVKQPTDIISQIPFLPAKEIVSTVLVNGEEKEFEKKNEIQFKKCRSGDKITLRVKDGYKVTGDGVTVSEPLSIDGGYEYTATIMDTYKPTLNLTVSEKDSANGSYNQKTIDNGLISLEKNDGTSVVDGDVMEDNEKVTVSITPNPGYYITGKDISEGIYNKSMKYSEYHSNIDKILKEHPISKYMFVTLTSNDQFGKVTYEMNGEKVSGHIKYKNGDKLKLKYALADKSYKIVRDGIFSFIGNITNPDNIEVEITLSEKFDGLEIGRSDFVTIEKR